MSYSLGCVSCWEVGMYISWRMTRGTVGCGVAHNHGLAEGMRCTGTVHHEGGSQEGYSEDQS